MNKYIVSILLLCLACCSTLQAQKLTAEEYIEKYKTIAIKEMKRSGIPASITLAQGLLESGNGNSRLAVQGNNHFGIKCHNDWTGGKIYEDDDKKNECFRKYKNAEESYVDHTNFLMKYQRYAFLFSYSHTDYKNWAHGLKKAGYATSSVYAQSLINLIERYNLQRFDEGDIDAKPSSTTAKPVTTQPVTTTKKTTQSKGDNFSISVGGYAIQEYNSTRYVIARANDKLKNVERALELMAFQLPKYNECDPDHVFNEGDKIYIEPKRRKAEYGKNTHTVKDGETLWSISQQYGVKKERLRILNRMTEDEEVKPGMTLNLRKKKKQK